MVPLGSVTNARSCKSFGLANSSIWHPTTTPNPFLSWHSELEEDDEGRRLVSMESQLGEMAERELVWVPIIKFIWKHRKKIIKVSKEVIKEVKRICKKGPQVPKRGLRFLQDEEEQCEEKTCGTFFVGEPHFKQLLGSFYDFHGKCQSPPGVHNTSTTIDLSHLRLPMKASVILSSPTPPSSAMGLGWISMLEPKSDMITVSYKYVLHRVSLQLSLFPDFLAHDVVAKSNLAYIESAAIRIGSDVLEVSSFGQYFLNSVEGADLDADGANMGNFSITHVQLDEKQHMFEIVAGPEVTILVRTLKDIVSLEIETSGYSGPDMKAWFGNSSGLMGSLKTSHMMARDGVTVINDPNEMGYEWQGETVFLV